MKTRTIHFALLLPLSFVLATSAAGKAKYGSIGFESLSQKQALNFDRNGKEVIGFLNTLTIGPTTIEADLDLHQPTAAKLPNSVGALGRIAWGGGISDPIELTAYVSAKNYHRIEQLLHEGLADTSVQFDFVVYNYDPTAKKYFKAFYPNNAPLRGLIRKMGGELQLRPGEKGTEVASPENWALSIVISPVSGVAELTYGLPNSAPTDKTWGRSN